MNIIVTGASRGIGLEMAKKFISISGNRVIAIARNMEKLELLRQNCLDINSNSALIPIVFDLSNTEQFESSLLLQIKNNFNRVDILINNAGYLVNKPFDKLSNADINSMVQVNLNAPARLIQCLLPLMKQGSHVVNISSMGGFQGSQKFPGLSIYSATKAGLASLTECLAEEYKGSGISFNCLALGATDTEMLNEAFPGYKAPFTADEMASFIADFALTKHKFINGKIIPVTISTP